MSDDPDSIRTRRGTCFANFGDHDLREHAELRVTALRAVGRDAFCEPNDGGFRMWAAAPGIFDSIIEHAGRSARA